MATLLTRERLLLRRRTRQHAIRKRRNREDMKWSRQLLTASVSREPEMSTILLDCKPDATFASLIAPYTPEQFFERYWEKQPLVIKRKGDDAYVQDYHSLFSLCELARLVDTKSVRFVENVNVCRYIRGTRENLNRKGVMTMAQLVQLFRRKKATLQFHQPQHFEKNLWRLLSQLETYFSCLVGSNVYITPPNSQGLAPHYDDVEAFILQLEGSKHWRLYAPPMQLPQEYSGDLNLCDIGEPTHDILLEAGDILYFPRGTIHQANTPTGGCHSTHITISTYQQHSWGRFLSRVISDSLEVCMAESVAFRRGLPGNLFNLPNGCTNSTTVCVKKSIETLLDNVTRCVDIKMAIQGYSWDFIVSRLPPPPPPGSDEEVNDPTGPIPTVTDRVTMCWRDYTYLWQSHDHMMVYHSLANSRLGHMIASQTPPQINGLKFPLSYKPALELLMESTGLCVSSLPLHEEDQRNIAVSLWSEGLLRVDHGR